MLTAKDYMKKFNVSYKTALKMIKKDKQKIGVETLLVEHFKIIYKVDFCNK